MELELFGDEIPQEAYQGDWNPANGIDTVVLKKTLESISLERRECDEEVIVARLRTIKWKVS